jgi:hypothetical protein
MRIALPVALLLQAGLSGCVASRPRLPPFALIPLTYKANLATERHCSYVSPVNAAARDFTLEVLQRGANVIVVYKSTVSRSEYNGSVTESGGWQLGKAVKCPPEFVATLPALVRSAEGGDAR